MKQVTAIASFQPMSLVGFLHLQTINKNYNIKWHKIPQKLLCLLQKMEEIHHKSKHLSIRVTARTTGWKAKRRRSSASRSCNKISGGVCMYNTTVSSFAAVIEKVLRQNVKSIQSSCQITSPSSAALACTQGWQDTQTTAEWSLQTLFPQLEQVVAVLLLFIHSSHLFLILLMGCGSYSDSDSDCCISATIAAAAFERGAQGRLAISGVTSMWPSSSRNTLRW